MVRIQQQNCNSWALFHTKRMEMRISVDRLKEIMSELQSWRCRTWCTKRQLLSIIGKLTWSNLAKHLYIE